MKYAVVAIAVPLKSFYTYSFDDSVLSVSKGIRVKVNFAGRPVIAFVVDVQDELDKSLEGFAIKPILSVVDDQSLFDDEAVKLALWMEKFYLCSRGEALSAMIPSGKRDTAYSPLSADDLPLSQEKALNEEQRKAYEAICSRPGESFYLFGITGSGKSEVFLQVAKHYIEQGRQVIYLVPEITLTHQVQAMVASRFNGRVAVLHSALSPSQRIAQWRRIRRGEVDLVIGARSAVFAPFASLGLIIIDEEHESSYKADNSPRYHARQVAQYRCSINKATLLMGSATPSMEAFKLMKEGKLARLDLKQRAAGGALPSIELVDMKGEKSLLGRRLRLEMGEVLGKGRQVILFLNRRGYSNCLHCSSCGHTIQCPHCSVAMTYHKSSGKLVCHYCGSQMDVPESCPECHSTDLIFGGFGTERVEVEVKASFPSCKVARIDTDTVKDKKALASVLKSFRDGDIDILIGTQMVAKGLNFPLVELVGVISADSSLSIPDFRAQERTFCQLVQVSGRSGRYDDQGKVILQAYKVDSPAIIDAMNLDLEGFYEKELIMRDLTEFPPYTRLINLVFRSKSLNLAKSFSEEAAQVLCSSLDKLKAAGRCSQLPQVIGAQECPLDRIAGSYRYHIVLRGKDFACMHELASKALALLKVPRGVYVEVDVDPVHLL